MLVGINKIGTTCALVLLIATGALTACSPPEVTLNCNFKEISSKRVPNKEIVVVLAPSDKFVDIKSATLIAKNEIAKLVANEDTKISIVVGDGAPRLIVNRVIEAKGQLTETGRKQKVDDALEIIDRVNRCIDAGDPSLFTVTPEIDVLDAIQKGGTSFSSDANEKYLFVIGNGLQTTGAFDFKSGLNADESANDLTVEDLVEKNAIGDLDGVNVIWIGLGQTRQSEQQQSLDENARSLLVSLWQKIVLAAGGNADGIIPGNVGEGATTTGGIRTSVVPFAAVEACIEPIKVTSEDGFEFSDNVATFLDGNKARASAERIKTKIDAAQCLDGITVTGYVASGGSAEGCARTPGFAMDLSFDRAFAFKKLLEEVGVSVEITPKAGGLGSVIDCENGKGVEELMKQNRIAVISGRQ